MMPRGAVGRGRARLTKSGSADSSIAVKFDEDALVLKTDVPDISALVGMIPMFLGSLYLGICSVGRY